MATEPRWFTVPPFMPGIAPVTALARELANVGRQAGLGWTTAELHRQLDTSGLTALADELLLTSAEFGRRRLLLVVDQLEELLTQTPSVERGRFAALLEPALAGPVQVVATLRSEFLDSLLTDGELADLPKCTHLVQPLRREALRSVIEGPSKVTNIAVHDDLVTRLVADTSTGEALPLLAYTLAELADGVERGGRLLTSRYDQLGGVRGALTRQAEAALADATAASGRGREDVIRELLRLVTVDEQGRPTRRRIYLNNLPEGARAELDCFVARRLLTTDVDNAEVVIGVAHEAILTAWLPLAQAISEASTALRARRGIEEAATSWASAERQPNRLWEGGQLAAALGDTGARLCADNRSTGSATKRAQSMRRRALKYRLSRHRMVVSDRVDLSVQARDFLLASIWRDRRRRGRSTAILSVLLVLSIATAVIAISQRYSAQDAQHVAEERQRIATARLLATRAEATLASDPRTALMLSEAAYHIYPVPEIQGSMVGLLLSTGYAGVLQRDHDVMAVAFAPEGHMLATASGNGSTVLWDLTDPTQPRRLADARTADSPVYAVAFAPDGHTLVTATMNGAVVWDLTDPTRPRSVGDALGPTPAWALTFTQKGHTLVSAGNDGTIRWDLTDPTRPRRLGEPIPGQAVGLVHAGQNDTIAIAGNDGTTLWDLSDPARPRRLGDPVTAPALEIAYASDGRLIATTAQDGTAMLWDLTDRSRPRQLSNLATGPTELFAGLAFAPRGDLLMRLRLGPPRWWSGWQVTLRLGEARLAGLR
jgi:hypothetical protein